MRDGSVRGVGERRAASDKGVGLATARRVSRRWPLVSASVAVALVVALGIIIALRPTEPFGADLEWMGEIIEHRSPVWLAPALVMNSLGGGILGVLVVPLVTVTLLLLFRRPWATLYYAVAIGLSAGAVQILKVTVGRARPSEILVQSDVGSFPSGHTANAATIAMVLAIVFPRVWVWVAGVCYTVVMMLSRTYLGAHWLSDTIGGLLLGLGLALIVWAPFAARLERERRAPHPPPWSEQPSSTL